MPAAKNTPGTEDEDDFPFGDDIGVDEAAPTPTAAARRMPRRSPPRKRPGPASRRGAERPRASSSVGRFLLHVLLVVLVLGGIWFGGLVWFAWTIPDEPAKDQRATHVIVVLTGGSGRLQEGFELLMRNKAEKLFISGVYRGLDVAELLKIGRQIPKEVECCVVLGYDADDTAGNARETAAWMTQEGFRSLRLVTANYHMRRSLLEFRHALPNTLIIPNPIFPETFKQDGWWRWPGTTSLIATEYTKFLFAQMRVWTSSGYHWIAEQFSHVF